MGDQINCHTCMYSSWDLKEPPCRECVKFNKFKHIKNREKVKPFYIGHRNNS